MSSEANPLVSPNNETVPAYRKRLALDPRPTAELNNMMIAAMTRIDRPYLVVIGILAVLSIGGFFGGWLYEIWWGLGIAGLNRPVFWGIYILSFVFWVGISHSGTFVSAVLRVFKAEYRRPITRACEMMTTFSLLVAVTFLGIDIGRPWRGYWILPYPNQRQIWPNFHSPFLWDEFAIISYLTGSTLYLMLPLIPDLAMARDRTTGWRHKLYRLLALGWRGTEAEWRHLHLAMTIFAWVIIPVMFSVHTIVSWDFAMTKVIGWRSSIFGPYFIIGAIYSGVSAVAVVLGIIRYNMKLHYFIREEHFAAIGKLVLILSFGWVYFFFNDYIVAWYPGDAGEKNILALLVHGQMAPFFWAMLFFNILVPWTTLWNSRVRRSAAWMMIVGICVNIGMYLERYVIVTGMPRRNPLPFNWSFYAPTFVEAMIGVGGLATFLLLYGLASRLIPLIPIWEVREGQIAHSVQRVGKAEVVTVAELD